MRREWLARFIVVVLVGSAIAFPMVAWWRRSQGLLIHARMAETGGWTPEILTAEVGKPLHLRLTSDDVTHSFAIGQSDQPAVDVKPGEVTEVTLIFDKPGEYTFYCTRWCSVNHWRMRGKIEVAAPGADQTAFPTQPAAPPLYVTLGLDIDAAHHAEIRPGRMPSAAGGAALGIDIPAVYRSHDYYFSHTPVELWKALRAEHGLDRLSDQEIWDLVAWIWKSNTTPQALQSAKALFATNCAACHGEKGGGDGVFAAALASPTTGAHANMPTGEMTTRPADFTDPDRMLSASPARLQGKILRGGMGTGMPYWGPIFTSDQTWSLAAYLWTFIFD